MRRQRMRILGSTLLVVGMALWLAGCGPAEVPATTEALTEAVTEAVTEAQAEETQALAAAAEVIDAKAAKALMDENPEAVILDVRTQEEFAEGHIDGALLMPYTEIPALAEKQLPEKDALILVYCRSGRRSAIAAQSLVDLGYTQVKDFGGINDWPYDIVK